MQTSPVNEIVEKSNLEMFSRVGKSTNNLYLVF